MIQRFYDTISASYQKKISSKGLALFRIVISIIILLEVVQMYYFRHLVFDKIPFLIPGELQMWPILIVWMIVLFFLIIGLCTKTASLLNYFFTVAFFGSTTTFEYHMFYSYSIVGFCFLFAPISKSFSIDRLLRKLKYSNTRFRYNPPEEVSVLWYHLIILVGIGFVYFDSIFYKFSSTFWTKGLGLWLPSSIPQTAFFDVSPLLNQEFVVLFLGYFTVFFEAIFLFIFFKKRYRVPILIVGLGLHIGILICYPIPLFALGVSAIYLLMVPVGFWDRLFTRKKNSEKFVKFYFDAECPLCQRTRIILDHLDTKGRIEFITVQSGASTETSFENIDTDILLDDIHSVDKHGRVFVGLDTYIRVFRAIWYLAPLSYLLRIPGIYHLGKSVYSYVAKNRTTERCTEDNCGFQIPEVPSDENRVKVLTNLTLAQVRIITICGVLGLLVLIQLLLTFDSALVQRGLKSADLQNSFMVKGIRKITKAVEPTTKVFLGMTHHAVFMDGHFKNYNHSIAVVYRSNDGREKWLPITDPDGTPGNYLFGPVWIKWTFRGNSPNINQEQFLSTARDFTAFWAHKNGVKLENATFEIKVKKNRTPSSWEKDFLKNQLQNPWLDAGTVSWKNNKFTSNVRVIEEM